MDQNQEFEAEQFVEGSKENGQEQLIITDDGIGFNLIKNPAILE